MIIGDELYGQLVFGRCDVVEGMQVSTRGCWLDRGCRSDIGGVDHVDCGKSHDVDVEDEGSQEVGGSREVGGIGD